MSIGDVEIGWTEVGLTDRIATGISNAWVDWINAPDGAFEALVEIDAFTGTGSKTSPRGGVGDVEIGAINIGVESVASDVEIISQLRYSLVGWVGDPDDSDRPNAEYDPRLANPVRSNRSMPYLPEQRPRSRDQLRIQLINTDGELDDLADRTNIDSRRVRVRVGPKMAHYSTYQTVADIVGTGWAGGRDRVEALARDRGFLLQSPLQTTLYIGTGDEEGDATIQGQPKPLVFGRVRNVAPVLIDPTNLIYQISNAALASIDDVFDQGLALTASGTDVADYSTLVGTAVSAGEYATALATGMFKLGGSPNGQVTADATGEDTSVEAITLDILRNYAVEDEARIDTASINGFGTVRTGTVGVYVGTEERPSIEEVLGRLIGGLGGVSGYTRRGVYTIRRLPNPDGALASLYLETADVIAVQPDRRLIPRWRQRVGYRRNYTVQSSDLASTIVDDRRQLLAQRQQVAEPAAAQDADVRTAHPDAGDPDPITSPYDDKADADDLAEELFGLHGTERDLGSVDIWRLGYAVQLGDLVNLPWPRKTSSRRRTMVCIGIEERGSRVRLRLWG